eukprot:SM000142S00531  [mRNA]  locus=s142:126906:135045:- [translate_table: standard]
MLNDGEDGGAAAAASVRRGDRASAVIASGGSVVSGPGDAAAPAQRELQLLEKAVSAAAAAVISAIIVNPLDVAKTRLQAQAATASAPDFSGRPAWACAAQPDQGGRCSPAYPRPAGVPRGGFAGSGVAAAAATPLCPPESLPYTSTLDVFHKVIRQEGFFRLWRGTNAGLAIAIPTVGIYLPLYDVMQERLGRVPELAPYAPLLAGSLSRAVACVICSPVELARTRMQAQKELLGAVAPPGMWATMREVVASSPSGSMSGVRRLWTGVGSQLVRDVPFSAICWATLEPLRRRMLEAAGPAPSVLAVVGANFSAGLVAGSLAAAATCPLDVAKTRRQIERDPTRSLSTLRTLAEVYRPEHRSTAAGVRLWQLARAFQRRGHAVAFASPCRQNEYVTELEAAGIATFHCLPNNEERFAAVLRDVRPQICIFDRFTIEEAFSFRVRELCPGALRVLDTCDLHFLRLGRMGVISKGGSILEALHHRPAATSAELVRELSAIHRSDLALVCSAFEQRLLVDCYSVPAHKVALASFYYSPPPPSAVALTFEKRKHFVTIGNFKHPPNRDSVEWLATELWPRIQKELPAAECHVYGAFMDRADLALQNTQAGFLVKGHAPSLALFATYRVCLAPLRFGAGLKGKILDSWHHGLPACTTPIGSEGLGAPLAVVDALQPVGASCDAGRWWQRGSGGTWGGLEGATTAEEFVRDSVRLHQDGQLWAACQAKGFEILESTFSLDRNERLLGLAMDTALKDMHNNRASDFVGAMLWYHTVRSTEYFSRWIELKERSTCKA